MAASPSSSIDIPFVAPHVLATMELTHVNLKVTPEANPLFAYSLAIPKAWAYSRQFGPVPGGLFATQSLGFFAGSIQPGSPVIAVTVTPIPYEIPIDTWVQQSLAAEGWHAISTKWFPGALGLFFDIVGTRVFNDVQEVRRTTVRVDGSNVFAVNCLCALKHWEESKEIFWAAHNTFELLRGTGLGRMEPWLVAKAERPSVEAAYPITWSASPVASPPKDVSALDVRLIGVSQETLLAYLQIKAERVQDGEPLPNLDQLRDQALSKLATAGFAPSGQARPFLEDEDPRSVAVEGWLGGFVSNGHLGSSDVTARLGFIHRDGVAISLVLLNPVFVDDPLVALRAQRAFEIARATLRLD